ncbi:iron-containing alcohol dehydrogenase [Lentilitoribacter sp. EG35]|uniref:iron-containing alcohol dehydrogenase n=1 Tax=Lentilitoribacter sp. EG35 TaxID=3234192 RepID=UPI00345F6439
MRSNKDERSWTRLIDEICEGRWISPLNGKVFPAAPYDSIVIKESLRGEEAALVTDLGFKPPFVVISDQNTHKAMGERVAKALANVGPVTEVILDHPHADMANVRELSKKIEGFSSVVAVGSGTVNDLTKYATFQDGRRYMVFGTAGSMNGYTSSTASITLDSGLKVSLPAQVPAGFFVDLEVCASAPSYLNAAGFGDCLCRSVAQIDWWMSHRLLGSVYYHDPYILEIPDEIELMERAEGIASGDIEAVGYLFRVLTLCGLGISFTGISNHGSMGEHQISHYIDCFARDAHPGSLHGQQVGVATLTMARIQSHFLSSETAPKIGPTELDLDGMIMRMGKEVATQCHEEISKKAFNSQQADEFNMKIESIWPELRQQCLDISIPVEKLEQKLRAAKGSCTSEEMGLPTKVYREAVCHGHEMRNRFSFADIADGAGVLKEIAAMEV